LASCSSRPISVDLPSSTDPAVATFSIRCPSFVTGPCGGGSGAGGRCRLAKSVLVARTSLPVPIQR
jgi:hypothetical protein